MEGCIFSSVNKLDVSDLSYSSAVCFTRAVKSAFEEGTSKGFHTTKLFGIVTQGILAITKHLVTIQRNNIPVQFGSMAKAEWEPGKSGR